MVLDIILSLMILQMELKMYDWSDTSYVTDLATFQKRAWYIFGKINNLMKDNDDLNIKCN